MLVIPSQSKRKVVFQIINIVVYFLVCLKLTKCQYPTDQEQGGYRFLAPGMQIQFTVKFCPPSLDNFTDELIIRTEDDKVRFIFQIDNDVVCTATCRTEKASTVLFANRIGVWKLRIIGKEECII